MPILVAGSDRDPNVLAVADAVAAAGGEVVRYIPELDSIEYGLDGDIRISGRQVRPASVFSRMNVFGCDQRALAFHSNCHYAVCGWASLHGVPCLPGYPDGRRNCKIRNLGLAVKHGLRVPETLVASRSPSECVAKPLQGGGHAVMVSGDASSPDGPAFFQERIDGPEIRVFVVDGQAIAFSVESPSLDYRVHQDAKVAEAKVPCGLAEKLSGLTKELGLRFAAADFKVNEEGPCFLEINSHPMFSAFDAVCGRKVSSMVAKLLV